MTKKDYELIAKTINLCNTIEHDIAKSRDNRDGVDAVETLAIRLSIKLAIENDRFDSDKFLTACGIPAVSHHRLGRYQNDRL